MKPRINAVSIGVGQHEDDTHTVAFWIKNTERVLHDAKATGRDHIVRVSAAGA